MLSRTDSTRVVRHFGLDLTRKARARAWRWAAQQRHRSAFATRAVDLPPCHAVRPGHLNHTPCDVAYERRMQRRLLFAVGRKRPSVRRQVICDKQRVPALPRKRPQAFERVAWSAAGLNGRDHFAVHGR